MHVGVKEKRTRYKRWQDRLFFVVKFNQHFSLKMWEFCVIRLIGLPVFPFLISFLVFILVGKNIEGFKEK